MAGYRRNVVVGGSYFNTQGALASLVHNLTGTAQDNTYNYTRNQAQEITGHSWNNDLYQWTGYTNGTRSYVANGQNQYTSAAAASLGYDANGNLTDDGVWLYSYDTDNRLRSAARTGLSATLAYDPEGRLRQTVIAGATTNLMYDGTDLVGEYDSTGTLLRRYVHGPGIDEPLVWYEGATTTNKNWLYTDHLGSVVATANSLGTSTASYSYGPYGEPNTTGGIRFRYTGQQYLGPLNLYYYKARFYSPTLGRFLQTDPIGYADDMNLYAYVGNDPLNQIDPDGEAAVQVIGGVANAGLGVVINIGSSLAKGESINWGQVAGDAVIDFGVGFVSSGAATVSKLYSVAGKGITAGSGEYAKSTYKNETAVQTRTGAAVSAVMNATGAAGKAANYVVNKAGMPTSVKPSTLHTPGKVGNAVAKEVVATRVSAPVAVATEYAKHRVGQNNASQSNQPMKSSGLGGKRK